MNHSRLVSFKIERRSLAAVVFIGEQKQVAAILGHGSTSMLSRYESGRSWPPLLTALRLEILYRIPVAFLYSKIYRQLKDEVRNDEDQLAGKGQLGLF